MVVPGQSLIVPLLDRIVPDHCAVCEGPVVSSGTGWCEPCLAAMPWFPPRTCAACGQPLHADHCPTCALAGRPWDRLVVALHYREQAAELVTRWKYHPEAWLSRPFGQLFARMLTAELDEHVDRVVAVPQTENAWRVRAFSPAGDLAATAARIAGRGHPGELLRRRRAHAQVGLTAQQRRRNVERLFRAGGPGAGGHALLVDDVVTTMATAEAAAEVLRDAGFGRVTVAALARAERDR